MSAAIWCLVLAAATPPGVRAETFCVSTASGLQAALDAAEANAADDAVRLTQGVYAGTFRYESTESHTLALEGGYTAGCTARNTDPALTTLDGMGVTYTIALLDGSYPGQQISVDGLTITGGAYSGLGLSVGSATISNVVATGNSAPSYGGGIFANVRGALTVRGCRIVNNTVPGGVWDDDGGGGLYVRYSASALVEDCVITDNTVGQWYGGGVYFNTVSAVTFRNNTVSRNAGTAAVELFGADTALVEDSTFSDNPATALYHHGYRPVAWITAARNVFARNRQALRGERAGLITGNVVTDNNYLFDGGGHGPGAGVMWWFDNDEAVVFENNVISGNQAWQGGGLELSGSGTLRLINNTIVGNQADVNGGGVRLVLPQAAVGAALADIANNIIAGNTAPSAADLRLETFNSGNGRYSTVNLFNNLFDASAAGFVVDTPGFAVEPSNLDGLDPGFVAPGDYRLAVSSPCIDAGSLSAPGLPAVDAAGDPRVVGGSVDIGAYEKQAPAALTLLSPSGAIATTTPTYSWGAQAGVDSYLLWVGKGASTALSAWYTAAAAGCEAGEAACSVTPTTALAPGSWFFNVKGKNAVGTGPWTASKGFAIASTPTALTLLSPSGVIGTATPTYTWTAQAGADSYQLWVGTGTSTALSVWYSAAAAGCPSGGTCSVTPALTLAAGTWYFNVKARNLAGTGPWAVSKGFTIGTPPTALTLVSPSGPAGTATPTYTWNAQTGVDSYLLWAGTGSTTVISVWYAAAAVGCGAGSGTCTAAPDTTLGTGSWYFNVKGRHLAGTGPWAAAKSFSTP